MARKTIGFVPLIWECDSCGTKNPGPIKTCTSCGAPQPKDVEFLQVNEDEFDFIKDEALIRMAKAGPDIHCPYCGTRNPSTAEVCSNCGGELSQGGKARTTGQRVRTVTEAQAPVNAPPMEKKGSKRTFLFVILGVLAVLAVCIALGLLFLKTDEITATVTGVSWERTIAIEAYAQVTDADWRDEVPAGADILYCEYAYRYTSDQPQANATEVCGEITVEDTGTGVGEVVQECTYEVYDEYCQYSAMAWTVVDVAKEMGNSLPPVWPDLDLVADQREGAAEESYVINFRGDGNAYTYTTTDADLFLKAEPGSDWTLEVNQVGGVQSAKPAN